VTVDNTAGAATLYCGGTALSSTGSILTGAQTSGALLLGALSDGSASLNANLDDVRIYSRALTAQEVATLAADHGDDCPAASAVANP
jgi:hypothetical protein